LLQAVKNLAQSSLAIKPLQDLDGCVIEHLDSAAIRVKQQATIVIFNSEHQIWINSQSGIQVNFQ
jgi:hypothetical protein